MRHDRQLDPHTAARTNPILWLNRRPADAAAMGLAPHHSGDVAVLPAQGNHPNGAGGRQRFGGSASRWNVAGPKRGQSVEARCIRSTWDAFGAHGISDHWYVEHGLSTRKSPCVVRDETKKPTYEAPKS